jgi:predicted Zn-dependent peptidase
MPKSDKAFDLAKDAIISRLRTERITKTNVLWTYLSAQKLGLDYDIRKDVFEKVSAYKLNDVELFQQNNIENIPYTYCVLGDKNMVDFDYLKTLGEVKELSQEEMFGY